MTEQTSNPKETSLPTNMRLLVILEEVVKQGAAIKSTDLIAATGLPKPTIHRLLQTLESEGFLQRDLDGRSYGPGDRLRGLAVRTMSSERIRTARLAILKGVADEIGETCNISTPDREGMTYLDRVETTWPLRIQLPIGTQVPFHCTAGGKMYLSTLRKPTLKAILAARPLEKCTPKTLTDPEELYAEIERIQTLGYATDDEEFMEDMVAIAVPVEDRDGKLIATLSVHCPKGRSNLSDLKRHLHLIDDSAGKLSRLLDVG